MLQWPNKDPDDILDYYVNWEQRLAGDILATSTWIFPTGIINGPPSASFTDVKTTVWISGGTDGNSYDIVNRVNTAGGRQMDQTVRIKVKTR